MYHPYQPAMSYTFKLPLRLVEDIFGRDNFDDCGDWFGTGWPNIWLTTHRISKATGWRWIATLKPVTPTPGFIRSTTASACRMRKWLS